MTSRLQKLLELYEKDTADAFVRYGIALEYSSLQHYDNAVEWFERLRSETPDYLPTYYMLGGLYAKLGRVDEARVVYEEGADIARRSNDMHTLSEIRAALDELDDE